MGKPRKRTKKYQYNRNRRKEWKKSKKLPTIQCEQIKEMWDESKSIKQNLEMMGLAADANKALPIPKAKDLLGTKMETVPIIQKGGEVKYPSVIQDMEAEASLPQARRVRLSQPEVNYCIYMMEKYGDNYKAMARDQKNYYQETPKQIRRKITTFKSIPEQYDAYLKSKQQNDVEKIDET